MAGPSAVHWHPVAAYLYILHLDGPALAWEYLRRNPHYQAAWLRHRHRPEQDASPWGLRLLENPHRDARDAHPDWFPLSTAAQLHPDADPPPGARLFHLWGLPGHKELRYDGQHLRLDVQLPTRDVHLMLAPALEDGMAYAYGVPALTDTQTARRARRHEPANAHPLFDSVPAATPALARERPTSAALLELHTLQALDGTLAHASLREVAQVLYGAAAVAEDWHADSGLRARVRRLVRRGNSLMRGGYRRLLQNGAVEQGRSTRQRNVPEQDDRLS